MNTKKLIIFIFLSITLTSCYTAKKMHSVTSEYTYENIDSLVAAVGMPSEERIFQGKRILTWYVSSKGVVPITLPSTSNATVYGYAGVTHVVITSSKTSYVPFDYN